MVWDESGEGGSVGSHRALTFGLKTDNWRGKDEGSGEIYIFKRSFIM